MIHKKDVEDAYPLTPLQEGLLFHALYDGASRAYFQQSSLWLHGPLDLELLRKSWNLLLRRHPVLRTAFAARGAARPLQLVLREREMDLRIEDCAAGDPAERERLAAERRRTDRAEGFPIDRGALHRMTVLRFGPQCHHAIWSFHHILMDGACGPILARELWASYAALQSGRAPQLPAVATFGSYVAWLGRQDRAAAAAFWRRYLEECPGPAKLPFGGVGEGEGYRLVRDERALDAESSAALRALARRAGVTSATLLQVLWGLLLSRYSGASDVVFGVTASGRPPEIPGIEGTVGLFINTLPVRLRFSRSEPVLAAARARQQEWAEWQRHGTMSLADLQAGRGQAGPLFEHLLVFEAGAAGEPLGLPGGLRAEPGESFEQTHYDLELSASLGERVGLRFSFDARRYDPGQVSRSLGHLQRAIAALAADPSLRPQDIDLVAADERAWLLARSCPARELAEPETRALDALLDEQVRRAPAEVAVEHGEARWTFAELDAAARRIASALKALGVEREEPVGLLVQRGPDLLPSLLGILRAGAAYVPLDPSWPVDRVRSIVRSAACRLVVCSAAFKEVPGVPTLDPSAAGEAAAAPAHLPALHPGQLAYVIFTSGSTGRPKGVEVTHGSVASFCRNSGPVFGLRPGDRLLAVTSIAFDISVLELVSSLAAGVSVVMPTDAEAADPDAILSLLQRRRITALQVTPSRLRLLLGRGGAGALAALRVLLVGGEPLDRDLRRALAPLLPRVRAVNVYGPTETTIWSCAKVLGEDDGPAEPPIGTPLLGEDALVLGSDGRLAPVGVAGEICLGGSGLGRGYRGDPARTASAFAPHPERPGERLYRTGDIGLWRPDGQLACFGRLDQQVKVRGTRVEPGEIEARLREHPDVAQAVVLAPRSAAGEVELRAYLQARRPLSAAELREFAARSLPEAMVPASFAILDALPLTTSGKVDRQALLRLSAKPARAETAQGPRDALEGALCEIWQAQLGRESVGVHDSFFELGGHSLTAMRVAAAIQKRLGVEIALRELFEAKTVAALAARLRGRSASTAAAIPALPPQPHYPASSAQRRLFVLDRLGGGAAYHLPGALALVGELAPEVLRSALAAVVLRHEALRTVLPEIDGEPRQRILAEAHFEWEQHDASAAVDPEGKARQVAGRLAARPFELDQGPLVRAALVRLHVDRHVLCLCLHHAIADGASMGVALREIFEAYEALRRGASPEWRPLRIQYKDFAAWEAGLLEGEGARAHRDYWHRKLGGAPPVLDLATDHPRPAVQSFRGGVVRDVLSAELAAAVERLASAADATLLQTLIALVKALLFRCAEQDEVVVGTPVSGRSHPELEEQVGLYVNTVALRDRLEPREGFERLLERVRTTVRDALEHSIYPFERLVQELQPRRRLDRSPLFDVMVVLSEELPAPDLKGLRLSDFPLSSRVSKFDLTFEFTHRPGSLEVALNFDAALFSEVTANRLLSRFLALASAAVRDPKAPLAELPMIDAEERKRILALSAGRPGLDDGATLASLFAARAAAAPESTALLFEAGALSYGQLEARARHLAERLFAEHGIGPERVVGLMLPRDERLVVALLGVLQAGGAYLPLDPSLPLERLGHMVRASGCGLVIAGGEAVDRARALGAAVMQMPLGAAEPSGRALGAGPSPDLPAYVLFTSGSTGRPKGVIATHRGVAGTIRHQIRGFGIGPEDRVGQFAPASFDAAASEVFQALLSGAALVMVPDAVIREPEALRRFVEEKGITVLTLPPAYLRALQGAALPGLRVLISAGSAAHADDLKRRARAMRVFNAYGPTEASICATYCEVDPGRPDGLGIPIGRPLDGTAAYVLDGRQELAPVGVAGELCLAGAGLARGYAAEPALTAERFVPLPFGDGARCYRTGDRARLRPDGMIEYLGRADDQVKVRGMRVELGEIEAVLRGAPGVRDAAVVARLEDGEVADLVAYVVGEEPPEAVRAFAALSLPGFMVPAHFVGVPALPLTERGKVDRKALPAPAAAAASSGPRAPADALEAELVAAFEGLLRCGRLGADDDFFALGGDSLKAIRLAAQVAAATGVAIRVADVFLQSTPAALAALVRARRGSGEEEARSHGRPDLEAACRLDPEIRPAAGEVRPPSEARAVLLTGATGFLGAYLLRELLARTGARVYCLVRGASGAEAMGRIERQLESLGLREGAPLDMARVVPIAGDLSRPLLGLAAGAFEDLASGIDLVVHNGAEVNFLQPFERLEAVNVGGTREALRLACARRPKAFALISTLSVFTSAAHEGGGVIGEEEALRGGELLGSGYAQSKWVAERLALEARRRGLPVAVFRPGRIVGDTAGGRAPGDLFSELFAACVRFGVLPDEGGEMDMTPVDYVAGAVVHLALRRESYGRAFHLMNSNALSREQLVRWLRELGHPVAVLAPREWRERLLQEVERAGEAEFPQLAPMLRAAGYEGRELRFGDEGTRAALEGSGIACPATGRGAIERMVAGSAGVG